MKREFETFEIKSTSIKSTSILANQPKTREDFLSFSIENVWKEMEEIGRSKAAA